MTVGATGKWVVGGLVSFIVAMALFSLGERGVYSREMNKRVTVLEQQQIRHDEQIQNISAALKEKTK